MAHVCDAVHHAHQHFIIHRDLKPSNILVDQHGHPKVLDFGVARITDSDIGATLQTDIGQLVGTLEYMSPEQARGDPSQVDTRSDIYALGVILYELLAGKLPYDLHDKSPLETLAIILTQDPAKLGAINRQYRGDIETIAAKCLEKDKSRRYSSAAELAADIRRYLNSEPITARSASFGYRLRKLARRNRAAVGATLGGAAALFAVVAAGAIATVRTGIDAISDSAVEQSRSTCERVKSFIIVRARIDLQRLSPAATPEEAKRSLYATIASDDEVRAMLVQTMALSEYIVEINVATSTGQILASSSPYRQRRGSTLPQLEDFALWRSRPLFLRLRDVAAKSSPDYQTIDTIAMAGDQHPPLFTVQLVDSRVLLRDQFFKAFRFQ